MRYNIALLIVLFLSSCGYTSNSSIDENLDGTERYNFYLVKYCSENSHEVLYLALTKKSQDEPDELTVYGDKYNVCGEKKHAFAIKQ